MGAKYLASALASGVQPFTKLWIRHCNITKIGGLSIAQSLAYDRGLFTLEIDENPLNMEVAIALHTVMKTNQNITYLSIQNCNVSNKMTNFLTSVAFCNRHRKCSNFDYVNVADLYDEIGDARLGATIYEEEPPMGFESEVEEE